MRPVAPAWNPCHRGADFVPPADTEFMSAPRRQDRTDLVSANMRDEVIRIEPFDVAAGVPACRFFALDRQAPRPAAPRSNRPKSFWNWCTQLFLRQDPVPFDSFFASSPAPVLHSPMRPKARTWPGPIWATWPILGTHGGSRTSCSTSDDPRRKRGADHLRLAARFRRLSDYPGRGAAHPVSPQPEREGRSGKRFSRPLSLRFAGAVCPRRESNRPATASKGPCLKPAVYDDTGRWPH